MICTDVAVTWPPELHDPDENANTAMAGAPDWDEARTCTDHAGVGARVCPVEEVTRNEVSPQVTPPDGAIGIT